MHPSVCQEFERISSERGTITRRVTGADHDDEEECASGQDLLAALGAWRSENVPFYDLFWSFGRPWDRPSDPRQFNFPCDPLWLQRFFAIGQECR